MSFINNWEDNGLHRKFTGEITGQEILESNLSIQGNPRFDHIKYVLNDFSSITEFEITSADVNIISTIDNVAAISKKSLKIAIVADDKNLLKWINEYLKMMQGSPYATALFSSNDDALKWAAQVG